MAFFSPSVNFPPRAILCNLQSLNTTPPTALLPQSIFLDMKKQGKERKEEADFSRRLRSRARIVPAGGWGWGQRTVDLSDRLRRRWCHLDDGSEGPCHGKAKDSRFKMWWQKSKYQKKGANIWYSKPKIFPHQRGLCCRVQLAWNSNLTSNPSNYIKCSLLCFNV